MKNVFYLSELVQHSYGLPIKIYLCQVERNLLHWHSDIELVYCVNGSLNLETEDGNYTLFKNDIVLINKNKVHRLTKTSEENVVFILQIDLSRYVGYVQDINNYSFKCSSITYPNFDYGELTLFFHQYIKILIQNPLGTIIRLRALTDTVVIHLIDCFPFDNIFSNTTENCNVYLERLNQVFNYVEKNYQSQITLDEITSTVHMNRYYFSHFFKKRTGVSFSTYLKQYRLEQSIKLLLQTNYNILEIANNCGFSSIQAYIKYFKEAYDLTPARYRKVTNSLNTERHILSTKYSEFTLLDPEQVLNLITD